MGRQPDPARRSELLDAVAGYLLEHGLADLSLRPLAAAIGTSPRMLLYHFGSKETLVVAALARAREREQELFSSWAVEMGAAEDPEQLARRAWAWMSDPVSEPFMRLFFEVYGMALQRPDRYVGFLDPAVEPRRSWSPSRADCCSICFPQAIGNASTRRSIPSWARFASTSAE